jgi:hypothetical protein
MVSRWLRRLERDAEGEMQLLPCPVCGKVFRVRLGAAWAYLRYWWAHQRGDTAQEPTARDVVRLLEHEHDASEFLDIPSGTLWLGKGFRGIEHEPRDEDVPDLSEPET